MKSLLYRRLLARHFACQKQFLRDLSALSAGTEALRDGILNILSNNHILALLGTPRPSYVV